MIARFVDGKVLADRELLAAVHHVSPTTIRRHCDAVATDPETRATLYDAGQAEAALAGVRPRRPRTRPQLRRFS